MTKHYALKWLQDAKRAPSGGNAQPWKVRYAEEKALVTFELSIDPQYLQNISAMDVKGAASALALGCLSLNLQILAQHDGFALVKRVIHPASQWTQEQVVLVFQRTQVTAPRWSVEDIRNRKTNRTKYTKQEIPSELLSAIKEVTSRYSNVKVLQFREAKDKLIPTFAALERIRWQTPILLRSVVKEINFGQDIKLAKDGIPATQLGANLADRALLRMIRTFPMTGALLKTPAVNLAVRKGTHDFIRDADSIFMLQVKENDFQNFLELGECFQALWLEAHRNGIAFQPTGTPLVALAYWLNREIYDFTAKQKEEIEQATRLFSDQFELDFKKLMMGFRIGYASQETEQCPRKNIEAEFEPELLKTQPTYNKKEMALSDLLIEPTSSEKLT